MTYEFPGDDEDDDARCPYCGARGSEPCHLNCGDDDVDPGLASSLSEGWLANRSSVRTE
jgi:hypothetical protein